MPRTANNSFTPRHTLTWGTKFLMYFLAIIFDTVGFILGLIAFIPLVGILFAFIFDWIITGIATLSFFVWFEIKVGHRAQGKSLSKRPLYMVLAIIIEVILGFLPTWIFFVFMSIRDVKKEDEQYNKEMKEKNAEESSAQRQTARAISNRTSRYPRGVQQAA